MFLPDKFFIGDKEFLIINLLKHPGVSADVISNNVGNIESAILANVLVFSKTIPVVLQLLDITSAE
uniref:hypothetical protein n=1 Tax=Mycoplasmopsis bovis TaxID=28903 RepID=UPI003D2AE5A8